MDFSKWTSIIKMILLKVIDEVERRINEKNGTTTDSFASSIYGSIKFIVMDQVDGLVDDVVNYTKKQINDLSTLVAEKTAAILASMVYVLILVGLFFLAFIFFAVALSLYLGSVLGNNYYGFLICGGVTLLLLITLYYKGHKSIAEKVKNHLIKLM